MPPERRYGVPAIVLTTIGAVAGAGGLWIFLAVSNNHHICQSGLAIGTNCTADNVMWATGGVVAAWGFLLFALGAALGVRGR